MARRLRQGMRQPALLWLQGLALEHSQARPGSSFLWIFVGIAEAAGLASPTSAWRSAATWALIGMAATGSMSSSLRRSFFRLTLAFRSLRRQCCSILWEQAAMPSGADYSFVRTLSRL